MYYPIHKQLGFAHITQEWENMTENVISPLFFVVHKHKASSLHYDFRIQVGSRMPSWAVPKGPSLDPAHRRLAIETTVHSLGYREFEGVLHEGSYGAGPVMIWDYGYYYPIVEVAPGVIKMIKDTKESQRIMKQSLRDGIIHLHLFGKKLKGHFSLKSWVGQGNRKNWTLLKHNDVYVSRGYNANDYDFSADSGKSFKEIENGG